MIIIVCVVNLWIRRFNGIMLKKNKCLAVFGWMEREFGKKTVCILYFRGIDGSMHGNNMLLTKKVYHAQFAST